MHTVVHMEPPTLEAPNLAAEIRACLGRSGSTREALASAVGISRQSLYRKLAGQSEFTVVEVVAIAAYFDLPVSELLRRAEGTTAA